MSKQEWKRLGIVFFFVLLLSIFVDASKGNISSEGTISRNDIGSGTRDLNLIVDVEGVMEEYNYELEIESVRATKDEAEDYFKKAIKEIKTDFEKWEERVPIQENYVQELVKAEWSFSPAGYVKSDGSIDVKEISKDGILITAKVVLICDAYEQIYSFPLRIEMENLSTVDRVKAALEQWFEKQQIQEGTTSIQLPEEIDGYVLQWSEKKEYLTLKVLFLELTALFLIVFSRKKQKEELEKARRQRMEFDYPEVVSQLTILLESGMNIRQAWNRIAKQYEENRKQNLIEEKDVFEAIVRMNRRILEGEKERTAYENFAEEISLNCYRKLMRILLGNLTKGNKDIYHYLDEESRQAYEQRILLAKKMGEEASTKMLLPMMLMMLLVMLIVMVPAIISFSI